MASAELDEVKVYEAIQKGIADTDNISFKLIGFVPLVSGAALLTILFDRTKLPLAVMSLVALFAAAITLGLLWWELRNIQTCHWFILLARELEQKTVTELDFTRPASPGGVGKHGAAKIIYGTTVICWLILPISVMLPLAVPDFRMQPLWWVYGFLYITLGLFIAWHTLRAVLTSTDPGSVRKPAKRCGVQDRVTSIGVWF
jgi:hypothetical protein